MRQPLLRFTFLLFFASQFIGCGSSAQVTFLLKGITPSVDGSFSNQSGWTIIPSEVRIVLGDLHLKRETPERDLQVFSSLPPLLTPGEQLAADQIGSQGRFPGMWAVNILQGATPHTYPSGNVEVANWNQIQLRMSPAVSGVRGITANDPLLQHTIFLAGQIRRDTASCNIRIRAPVEIGLAKRIEWTTKATLSYKNPIDVNYNEWLNDVQFGQLCTPTTKDTIDIDNQTQPAIIESIRSAITTSIDIKFGQGSAL
jgi:hypothetical protein